MSMWMLGDPIVTDTGGLAAGIRNTYTKKVLYNAEADDTEYDGVVAWALLNDPKPPRMMPIVVSVVSEVYDLDILSMTVVREELGDVPYAEAQAIGPAADALSECLELTVPRSAYTASTRARSKCTGVGQRTLPRAVSTFRSLASGTLLRNGLELIDWSRRTCIGICDLIHETGDGGFDLENFGVRHSTGEIVVRDFGCTMVAGRITLPPLRRR